jgi:hypothetical protein
VASGGDENPLAALTDGFSAGFTGGAGVAALGATIAAVVLSSRDPKPEPAADTDVHEVETACCAGRVLR